MAAVKTGKKQHRKWIIPGAVLFILIIGMMIASRFLLPDTIRVLDGGDLNTIGGVFQITVEPSENDTYEVVHSTKSPKEAIQLQYANSEELMTNASGEIRLFGLLPIKSVRIEVWEEAALIPCGDIIGIDIATNGVMILGTGQIETSDGALESPAKGKIYSGDLIHKINGKTVETIDEVNEILKNLTEQPVTLLLERSGSEVQAVIEPVQDVHGIYRLGIWLRDREQGLGTLTYVNPQTGDFGAIGHGITDVDTREILSVGSGIITTASVIQIVRGETGQPGEIQGAIGQRTLGRIQYNTENGIYGLIDDTSIKQRPQYPIALKDTVKDGTGYILCSLDESDPQAYEVHITKQSSILSGTSSFIVEITDSELLAKTGGIVQGM